MIHQDGARVIFATSYGYLDPFVLRVARESLDVQFFHCGGSYREGIDPPNIGIYFGFIDEVEYLAGLTPGLMTRTGRLGFVAAKPIPQVLRNINSFMLGARSVNPSVSMKVLFTGDWVLPLREAEAASSLADQGADVLTGHTGSPRVIVQVAERRGIWAMGYQFDQSVVAPAPFPDRGGVVLGSDLQAVRADDSRRQIRNQRNDSTTHDRYAQRPVLSVVPIRSRGNASDS